MLPSWLQTSARVQNWFWPRAPLEGGHLDIGCWSQWARPGPWAPTLRATWSWAFEPGWVTHTLGRDKWEPWSSRILFSDFGLRLAHVSPIIAPNPWFLQRGGKGWRDWGRTLRLVPSGACHLLGLLGDTSMAPGRRPLTQEASLRQGRDFSGGAHSSHFYMDFVPYGDL